MITLNDGDDLVVRLPSGQLVKLADVRVGRIEFATPRASFGRGAAGPMQIELYLSAGAVAYADGASENLAEAVRELADAVGVQAPDRPGQPQFTTVDQRSLATAPIGPHGLPVRRFEGALPSRLDGLVAAVRGRPR